MDIAFVLLKGSSFFSCLKAQKSCLSAMITASTGRSTNNDVCFSQMVSRITRSAKVLKKNMSRFAETATEINICTHHCAEMLALNLVVQDASDITLGWYSSSCAERIRRCRMLSWELDGEEEAGPRAPDAEIGDWC